MPGLADMHIHLRREGKAWLPLYLAAGVTTVLNMGGTKNHLAWRQRVIEGNLVGPTIYSAGPQIGKYKPLTSDQAERLVVEQKRAGYDFIKVYSNNPGNWSRETYERVIATAENEGIAVTGHAPRNLPFEVVLRAGRQSIAHTEELLYTHFDDLDESRIPALATKAGARNLWLITTFSTFENIARLWGKPAVAEAALEAPLARYLHRSQRYSWKYANPYTGRREHANWIQRAFRFHFPLIKSLHESDVRLVTGTDVPIPVLIPGFAIYREVEILTEAGLTPFEALAAATRNAGDFIAESIEGAEDFGRVSPGYRADLLLLGGDPLQDLTVLEKPLGVMARGRWFDREKLDAMLEAMAAEFSKPSATIETAFGQRMTDETLKATLSGATLSGRNARDEPYSVHLAPDGGASEVGGPIGDRVLTGKWWVKGDEYCLRYEGRTKRCLTGVRDGSRITWYLDVGGWFDRYYIRFTQETLTPR